MEQNSSRTYQTFRCPECAHAFLGSTAKRVMCPQCDTVVHEPVSTPTEKRVVQQPQRADPRVQQRAGDIRQQRPL